MWFGGEESPAATKGGTPFHGAKSGRGKKMGECTVGWDGIINHSEEIPWVAQGEISLLMECIRRAYFASPRTGGQEGAIESVGTEVCTEVRKPQLFTVSHNRLHLWVCTEWQLFWGRTKEKADKSRLQRTWLPIFSLSVTRDLSLCNDFSGTEGSGRLSYVKTADNLVSAFC